MEHEAAHSSEGSDHSPTSYLDLSELSPEYCSMEDLLWNIAGPVQPSLNSARFTQAPPKPIFLHQPGPDAAGDAGLHQPGPYPVGDASPSAGYQCFGSLGVNAGLPLPATGTDVARLENDPQPQFTSSIAQPHPYNSLDANAGLAQPVTGIMEIPRLESAQPDISSLGVDGGLAQPHMYPARDVGPSNTASIDIQHLENALPVPEAGSLDSDESFISYLRKFEERWRRFGGFLELESAAGLAKQDPEEIVRRRPWYLARSSSTETIGALWKAMQNSFTAIPCGSGESQRYIGAKKTYEFQKRHGGGKSKKTEWFMHEYYLLEPRGNEAPGLVIQEDWVLRYVFCKEKDEVSSTVLPVKRKSSAPLDIWPHFTQIYNKDDKLLYAVCHDCHRIFCAQTKKHGTNSLGRHHKTCSSSVKASTSSQSQSMQPNVV